MCNAHLLRELLYVEELTGERWPAKMSELLLRTNELCEAARRKNIVLGAADVAALHTFYDAILSEGERCHPARLKPSGKSGRIKQSVAFNLLLRLRRYADAVLLFVSDPAVPFTNNLGERVPSKPTTIALWLPSAVGLACWRASPSGCTGRHGLSAAIISMPLA